MEKDIYIKTEPGGKVCFGKMSDHDVELFNKSKINQTLSKDILYKVKRGLAPYKLIEGVINTGANGDHGNEGLIEIAQDNFVLPNSCTPGIYVAYFALSKVSIEFQIKNKSQEQYDSRKLVEESVIIDLPSCVRHGTYNDLNFNLVIGYKYDGKQIRNANKGMVDRGYEESISIFSFCNNEVVPLYEMVDTKEVFF